MNLRVKRLELLRSENHEFLRFTRLPISAHSLKYIIQFWYTRYNIKELKQIKL